MLKLELPPLSTLILIFLLFLCPQSSISRTLPKRCGITQCGNVNISHPFRLKAQPPECGDCLFELDCEADINQLTFFRRYNKFQVHEIFYENSTLTVSYQNQVTGNCSLPPTGRFYEDFFFCEKLLFPAWLIDDESSPGVIEAQHSLEESNVPLFHRLPSNLLNSIQLPSEAFWATGGRPPFLLTISINYHYLENSVQLHLQASTIAKRMINKKLDL
ncbi:hypothetical protein ES332_D11G360600v1 [Gossypium tomentosum]|uniref:Wall-associated receptor kinase galacturonan-binding domain-containing protein n=1 Tax=Gossypium tomentosum TaxID=34277 RepID=A0A5D2IXG1_GOSTO|nr:hypothetical protein ES332_D11G360600v1 [Gossypium tomentosum]